MKKLLDEYKDFINKGDVIVVAVGLIMALYFAEIVNAKPEQRRRILEDAAGIAGLHSRRRRKRGLRRRHRPHHCNGADRHDLPSVSAHRLRTPSGAQRLNMFAFLVKRQTDPETGPIQAPLHQRKGPAEPLDDAVANVEA